MNPPRSKRKTSSNMRDSSPIVEKILNFMEAIAKSRDGVTLHTKKNPRFDSMVDVGCGDGKSTLLFSPYFRNVTGIDKSKSQILRAEETTINHVHSSNSSVTFQVASGESMPFQDCSQDLVCFSRSFHWMELMSDALREARRVLKPNGCLAMYCTGFPKIELQLTETNEVQMSPKPFELNKRANDFLDQFFRHSCELHPRSLLAVDDKYRRIYEALTVEKLPKKGSKFIVIDDKNLAIRKKYVTLTEFSQMLKKYAGYKCAMMSLKKRDIDDDPLINLLRDIRSLSSTQPVSDEEIFLNITWDVSLILSTRPAKIK